MIAAIEPRDVRRARKDEEKKLPRATARNAKKSLPKRRENSITILLRMTQEA